MLIPPLPICFFYSLLSTRRVLLLVAPSRCVVQLQPQPTTHNNKNMYTDLTVTVYKYRKYIQKNLMVQSARSMTPQICNLNVNLWFRNGKVWNVSM